MLVYTNTDEADVGRIRVGAQATFRVDTFPRETFNGTVSQVRMNATTIQNVVTYNTTVAFDNLDLRLFPGMTAYISIPVAEAKNVVKIPNGALRFKPDLTDSERTALYAKYGIQDTARATAAGRIAATAADGAAAGSSGNAATTSGSGAGQAAGGQAGQGGPGGGGRRGQGGPGAGGANGGQGGGGAGAGAKRQAPRYCDRLEAASRQDSGACASRSWRYGLHFHSTHQRKREPGRRSGYRSVLKQVIVCANAQPCRRPCRRHGRSAAQVLAWVTRRADGRSNHIAIEPNQSEAGGKPVIRLENVFKTYDLGEIQVQALRGVSLEVHEGEFVAVMGPSGSGKSRS